MLNRISRTINHHALGGDPTETVCGRAYREGWAIRHLIDALAYLAADLDHCLLSGTLRQ